MSTNSEDLEQKLKAREEERVKRNEAVRQQWLASKNRKRALELSFPAFERRVRQILSSSDAGKGERHRLYVLPMSEAQLARQRRKRLNSRIWSPIFASSTPRLRL